MFQMDDSSFDNLVRAGLAARWGGSQAIVVRAEGVDSADASMRLYERRGGGWAISAGPWRAVVGKGGVSKCREGDGRSPSGAFLLGMAFGRIAKPEGLRYPYRRLDDGDCWVDDASFPYYNRWVRCPSSACGGGENLSKIGQYRLALPVRYNDEAEKGRGSAIFVHVWRGPGDGTQGCAAVSDEHIDALFRWLDYAKRPVLVLGTAEEFARIMGTEWGMCPLPEGWGYIDDYVPDAQLEIRYNTANNFTGRRLPGYRASLAPMRLEALDALSRVAEELRQRGLGIRVYDAYRPQRATDAMIAWAQDASDTATKPEYYPEIDKESIPGKFVARRSAHRLGGTIDLTVLDWGTGTNLDMGGPFDFFGELSSYEYEGITDAQSANRTLLREVMTKHGFKPYDREWWHFSFPVEGEGGDFDILPRACLVDNLSGK